MIGDMRVFLWALAVACAFLGYGIATLRILRIEQHRWLTGASTGCAVVVTMLGLMNLMRWVRPLQISVMIAAGNLIFLLLLPHLFQNWKQKISETFQYLAATLHRSKIFAIMTCSLLALALWIALSGINSHVVNRYDDSQAYLAYPESVLQTGSLQPQPFSERRVSTSLGANYLLDTVMVVDGDVRSISFIDLCFGYLLYGMAIWTVGTSLELRFEANGLLLLLLIILPPLQVNETIVYLSSALMVVLLLTMHANADQAKVNWKSGVLCGLLASVLCLTKSNNIAFTLPLILIYALSCAARSRSLAQIWNAAISLATLAILTLPWMVQQYRNEGTFFFPTLGRGFHASHWGLLPLPGQTFGTAGILMSALPFVLVLLLAVFLTWKLRLQTSSFDLAVISYLVTAIFATLLVAFATSGEAVDRYSFPFHIPALLLFAAFMLRTFRYSEPTGKLLWFGRVFLFAWVSFMLTVCYSVYRLHRPYVDRIAYVDEKRMDNPANSELLLTNNIMREESSRARNAQSSVPAGENILESVLYAYPYDFRRNIIYIADYPGMAGWSPGIPVGRGPNAVRIYLLSHDIRYYFVDRRLPSDNRDIESFLKGPKVDFNSIDVMHRLSRLRPFVHAASWSRMEDSVSRDVRHNLLVLADTDDKLYDDGTVVVVRLKNQ